MKGTIRSSAAALLILLAAGCGVGPVVWPKTIDAGGDESATALASDGTSFYVSYVSPSPERPTAPAGS